MKLFVTFYLLFFGMILNSQSNILIGFIKDKDTQEPLIGALVISDHTNEVTNKFGYFSLNLESVPCSVTFSYLGYQDTTIIFKEIDHKVKNIFLRPNNTIEEVEIVAQRTNNYRGNVKFTQDDIEKIPTLLGEVDYFKSLATLPGISTGYAYSSGLFVRGGSPDQNLILLDDATIYNPSHLYGFISSFNSDVLQDVELYKGYIPARYEGRISSVLDLRAKNGSKNKLNRELTLSPLFSRLLYEGPIIKDKTSFVLGLRASYLSLFTLPSAIQFNSGKRNDFSTYYMGDANLKINHKFSESKFLSFNAFINRDWFLEKQRVGDFITQNKQIWGNKAFSLKYNEVFKNGVFLNWTVGYSDYNATNKDDGDLGDQRLNGEVGISVQNIFSKTDFEYQFSKSHQLNFGVNISREIFEPGSITYRIQPEIRNQLWTLPNTSLKYGPYLDYEWKIGDLFQIDAGINVTHYGIDNYNQINIEPRIGIGHAFSDRSTINVSYTRLNQTANLLASNGLGLSSDFWIPAVNEYPVSRSDNYAIDFSRKSGPLTVNASVFYREMKNLVAFKEGIDYLDLSKSVLSKIQTGGKGRSYGLETFIGKSTEKYDVRLSYTLSKSERLFENVNKNEWYDFKYDRTHDINLYYSYKFRKKYSFNANFTYATGIAFTLPETYILNFEDRLIPVYTERNNTRFPHHHNLDISFVVDNKSSKWTFGVNNVYARYNYASITFDNRLITERPPGGPTNILGSRLYATATGIRLPLPFIAYTKYFDR